MSYFLMLFTYLKKKIKLDSRYKLISNSYNKKFRFLPVQSPPGCLQHLNLEPNFIFFFKYVNNIKNMTFLFYKLISKSLNKKFRFFTCPEYTWMPADPELGARFHFFLQICKQHKKYDISALQVDL